MDQSLEDLATRDHVLYCKNSVGKCYEALLEKLDSECIQNVFRMYVRNKQELVINLRRVKDLVDIGDIK